MSNKPKKDLHQLTQGELINLLAGLSLDQARSILPEFNQYYQNRKKVWALIRENKPVDDISLESEISIAILNVQSLDWSKTEIENKILDIFGRIQEQEEIILYEISQEFEPFA